MIPAPSENTVANQPTMKNITRSFLLVYLTFGVHIHIQNVLEQANFGAYFYWDAIMQYTVLQDAFMRLALC